MVNLTGINDLKFDDIVVLRNNTKWIVRYEPRIPWKKELWDGTNRVHWPNKFDGFHNCDSMDCDIVAVYRGDTTTMHMPMLWLKEKELIWEESICETTIERLEKKLGYPIKIVK